MDIANITIGEFVHKNIQDINAKYPVYNGGMTETGFYSRYNNTANKIIMSARGANAGFVNRVLVNYWAGNSCYTIDVHSSEFNWNYIFYILKQNQNSLIGEQQKGGIPAVSKKQVENIMIPSISSEEQNRTISILDKFSLLLNDISIGLPAELKARRSQYEYYRGKLLTFKEYAK